MVPQLSRCTHFFPEISKWLWTKKFMEESHPLEASGHSASLEYICRLWYLKFITMFAWACHGPVA
jgi:hypothetical protein